MATEQVNTTMASRRAARLKEEEQGVQKPPRRALSLKAGLDAEQDFTIINATPPTGDNVARWSDGRLRTGGLHRA